MPPIRSNQLARNTLNNAGMDYRRELLNGGTFKPKVASPSAQMQIQAAKPNWFSVLMKRMRSFYP